MKFTYPHTTRPFQWTKNLVVFAALRPRQWTKNLVVFAAPWFNFNTNLEVFSNSLLAFILFCCTSSSFYLLNDILDIKSDRQHPIKCKRPIASGAMSIPVALTMAGVLLGSSLVLGWLHSLDLGVTLASYALLQIAYNLKLKHTVIVDIIAIATGFVLRAYAGAAATGITVSSWFIVCVAMLALFLGIEKRKAELRLSETQSYRPRQVLKRYSLPLLLRMESTVTTGTFISYTLWCTGSQVKGASTPWMLLTLPFVLYGIFRYQLLSDSRMIVGHKTDFKQEERTEQPEEVLLTDKPILLTILTWGVVTFIIKFLEYQRLIG